VLRGTGQPVVNHSYAHALRAFLRQGVRRSSGHGDRRGLAAIGFAVSGVDQALANGS